MEYESENRWEIFYIEADRWMTGGATRGQGREIITKIEREVNDR